MEEAYQTRAELDFGSRAKAQMSPGRWMVLEGSNHSPQEPEVKAEIVPATVRYLPSAHQRLEYPQP